MRWFRFALGAVGVVILLILVGSMFRGCGSGTTTPRGPVAQPGNQPTPQPNQQPTPQPEAKPDPVIPESQKALDETKRAIGAGKDVDTEIGVKAGQPAEADQAEHRQAVLEKVRMRMTEEELVAKKAELKSLKDEEGTLRVDILDLQGKIRDRGPTLIQMRIDSKNPNVGHGQRLVLKATADEAEQDMQGFKEGLSRAQARLRELPGKMRQAQAAIDSREKAIRSFTKDGKTEKE
jgi:hypothetical protein